MKKDIINMFRTRESSYLSKIFIVVLLAVLYLHYKIALILEPSSFDMILELTTQKMAPILKSSIVLSNYRPQLGQFTFLMTGETGKLFGILGSYIIRYVFFFLNLIVFVLVFKEYLTDKKLSSKNLIFFVVTSGLSFFAMIKYFYVVDFLTAILFSFLTLFAILQNRSKIAVFLFMVAAIYFKFSILLFLFPLLVIGQKSYKELFRYIIPIGLATIIGLIMFFMKSVDHVLGQRGLFTILKHDGFLNFFSINSLAPWEFFKYFDQSVANYSLDWSFYIVLKLILVLILALMIFVKNKISFSIDCLCLLASANGIIGIQPYSPWFHDIGFYVGIIGLLTMVIAWKYKAVVYSKNTILVIVALFVGDFYSWNQSIKSVGVVTTKFELQEVIKREVQLNNVTDLYLYCKNNIGEFEWNLTSNPKLNIHYVIDTQDVTENFNRPVTTKSLWLFPKKCLHENAAANIGNDPSPSAAFKKNFYLNSMEYYRLYSNY